MAVQSYFYNSTSGDRKYNADNFASHTNAIINDGVTEGLLVSSAGAYTVNVAVGQCIILGRSLINDATLPLTVTTPVDGQTWLVVAQIDLNAGIRAGKIYLKQGALTSTSLIKEIRLGTLVVSGATLTITDTRMWSINDSNQWVTDSLGNVKQLVTIKDGNSSGIGVGISAGGTTVVGSGESHTTTLSSISDASQETMYVTSDNSVIIRANQQSGVDSTKDFSFNNGIASANGIVYGSTKVGTRVDNIGGIPLKMSAGQTVTCSVPLDQCPNGWLMRWRNVDDNFNQFYTPIYKDQAQASNTSYIVGMGSVDPTQAIGKFLTHDNNSISGNSYNSRTNVAGVPANNQPGNRELVSVTVF